MKRKMIFAVTVIILFVLGQSFCSPPVNAADRPPVAMETDPFETEDNELSSTVNRQQIADPLEKYNRLIHAFNDKLYFYFLKPVAKGYCFAVPKPARKSIKRVFYNAAMPGRFINCVFQGKFQGAGNELARFSINTTFGLGGIFSPAENCIRKYNEDSGQTLGTYGMGQGFYIVWPFLGPSSLRGTIGSLADTALNPLTYVQIKPIERLGIKAYTDVNDISLRLEDYEQLKKSALDHYISLRNAYFQYRQGAIRR